MNEFVRFIKWCQQEGIEPSNARSLHVYMNDVVTCPVCDEPTRKEHMRQSRFDHYIDVCEQCKLDGN